MTARRLPSLLRLELAGKSGFDDRSSLAVVNRSFSPSSPAPSFSVATTNTTSALTLSYASKDHKRVKGLIESAHAMLAGLDASDEMAFALAHDKLASVHLNDQNGLKYDQDKNFGGANLRAAFNQVRDFREEERLAAQGPREPEDWRPS